MDLARIPEVGDWCLTVQQAQLPLPLYGYDYARTRKVTLRGEDARRTLAAILPHINSTGGTRKEVRAAVDTIASTPNVQRLVYDAAGVSKYRWGIPRSTYLALEMALHAEDEQRAMEGELAALEARWREAEEIARIADSLALPTAIEAQLGTLRGTDRVSAGEYPRG